MGLTVLRITAASVLGLLVVILSTWCMWIAATHERPAWRSSPVVASTTWWAGMLLYFTLLGLIVTSLMALIIGAVVRLVLTP